MLHCASYDVAYAADQVQGGSGQVQDGNEYGTGRGSRSRSLGLLAGASLLSIDDR